MANAAVKANADVGGANNGDLILLMPRIGGTLWMKIRVMD